MTDDAAPNALSEIDLWIQHSRRWHTQNCKEYLQKVEVKAKKAKKDLSRKDALVKM